MVIKRHSSRSKRLRVLATGLAAFITVALLMAYQFVSDRKQLVEELRTEAMIIGASSSAALVFNDQAAAREILTIIRLTPRILGGALYSADGRFFVAENDAHGVFPENIEAFNPNNPAGIDIADDPGLFSGLIREEVFQDSVRVGTLLLHVTYESLYWRLLDYALGVVLIIAFGFLLAHRFTLTLRKRMAFTEGQLEHMALYDRVTDLHNRHYFEHELRKAITRIKREGKDGALLYFDVDDFKKVNDLCGHQAGDDVLRMIAERLKKTTRSGDIIGRVGGDEFAAILFGVGTPESAAVVADNMIRVIAEPFPTEPIESHVGLSIGVTMIPVDSDDSDTLLRCSDMAMYVAKSLGKNRYQFFSEEINNRIQRQLEIEAALRKALKADSAGLWVAYQPQVCAKTGRLMGVEALMRWAQDDGKPISPADFIPVAEKTGLIIDLGKWVLKRVCRDLAELRSLGIEIPKVAINVSPRELTRGYNIVGEICQTLVSFGERVGRFQFEVTENALMDDNGADVLDAFRDAGFSLAIDDFGSGYSSLGYLKRFQVSALKIDQQFVQRLPDDAEDGAIASAVIQMSKALGITVVAEGVETEAQAAFLAEHGCDILQGYLISRPIAPQQLIEFIRK